MQFANDELGIPYSAVELVTDSQKILELRQPWLPARAIPHGAVALTCGIDVQKRGFWFLVKAWMPTMASFIIDYGSLETWEDVAKLCFMTHYPVIKEGGMPYSLGLGSMGAIPQEYMTGEVMPIWRVAMDTGRTSTDGVYTRTEEIYLWIRANGVGIVHACKGGSRAQAIAVRRTIRERMPHNGRPIPGGLALHMLDTNILKTIALGRMLNPENSQPTRFHADCAEDLANQLSSEQQVRRGGSLAWEREYSENHLLDCEMMATACADPTWTPSLPAYVLQLKASERTANMAPVPQKKRERQHKAERRWG